jgi:hypothetical protein
VFYNKTRYSATKCYIKNKFDIDVSDLEADYLSPLFQSTGGPGKWYPLGELKNIPLEKRKTILFEIASKIIGYNFSFFSIIKKQPENKAKISNSSKMKQNSSAADEIGKFKKLLDEGAITLDEYERKKKDLLM